MKMIIVTVAKPFESKSAALCCYRSMLKFYAQGNTWSQAKGFRAGRRWVGECRRARVNAFLFGEAAESSFHHSV
jgi:hypothetical protein